MDVERFPFILPGLVRSAWALEGFDTDSDLVCPKNEGINRPVAGSVPSEADPMQVKAIGEVSQAARGGKYPYGLRLSPNNA
jgi:hypothetical protein